ncbi:MAG: guanitoxin biosynthesis PLP-dependent transaminase GntE [Anaerolineae bacterium]|nr:guanitoxin biosynthesis PLP-dependent transaminase GntE [Anaerolineae bacterium]MDK1081200.1 guanitoxin biosynthesis PLP-dependent transaminase GntE [Anaerolineae bacterium]MDK1118929.1 guanitoxin biosynthesis PLP-dependent transaminase GntE [Anaerolineae bacterium]
MTRLKKSIEYHKSALKSIPLGVNSNFRYWGPEDTLYISHGKGTYIWDVDENRYIDYRLGWGPIILGHSDDRVDEAVYTAMRRGQTFAFSNTLEQQVAEKIVQMCPGVDKVRFANSGTEATMHALRLARAYTGREKFIMFEGQYHGLHDYVMFSTNVGEGDGYNSNRRSPVIFPMSSGIPHQIQELVLILPFNDLENLERVVKQSGHELAAILVEPILGNAGGITPAKDWLSTIRKVCDQYGIVMIMDEIKTGFRIAKGGAQEYYGVKGDLATYAKALGNGYPVAAFGGKKEIMDQVGQGVAHGGTFTANHVSMGAANATLDILMNTDALAIIEKQGQKLQEAIAGVLKSAGLPCSFSGHPAMFMFWLADKAPKEYREWIEMDHDIYNNVTFEMFKRGVMPEPDSREPWFLCASLSDEDIAKTATVLEDSLKVVLAKNNARK